MSKDYLTIKEFRKKFGISKQAVWLRIQSKTLKAKVATRNPVSYLIPLSEAKAFKVRKTKKRRFIDRIKPASK